ncbi:peptide/nickel transport system substrate-binding protein [Rhodococcus sp. SMB37]|uniref:ABC transporter substrate-binding protein n=1 Tax=Rhodococcus sp. SMB37 TaxID=2512213 RepID=UPI00104F347D|nr:ABC transporter substrate-binding protein [Rhodococcus sp. SMB37]TCN50890.1 peptide/nickel transport system substrate-binding protein [Rhodococcus sp. SMB37]
MRYRTHLPRSTPLRAAAALAASVAVLAGCSTSDEPNNAGDPNNARDDVSASDVFRYVAPGSSAVSTNDPHGLLPAESDVVRMALTYDPLTVPGADGQTQPRLAESWEPDETLTEWTITLRDDARFSDGSPVTAADALFSLRRMGEKSAENSGRVERFDLDASEATSDTTLLLRTKEPYAEVGQALEGSTFVVPEGSADFTELVPGSGPFRPAFAGGQVEVFERNNEWWGPVPPMATIEMRAIPDPQARADAVTSGQADLAAGVPASAVVALDESSGIGVVRHAGATLYPLVMRTDTAPFDDNRVREAVRNALDRDQLLDVAFLGQGQLGNDVISPQDPAAPDLPQRTRDLDRARELMAEAGLADGVDVTLNSTTAYPGMDSAATLIAQQLADIGIRVKVELSPPDTYFQDVYAQRPFYISYLGGIPFLDITQVALRPDSPTNETAWGNPAWSAKLAETVAEPDDATRDRGIGELMATLRDEGGYAIWAASDRLDLAAPGVTGVPEGIGFASAFIDQVDLEG